MWVRVYAEHDLTWLARAEAIALTFERGGVSWWLAPVGLIDGDARSLADVRDKARRDLRECGLPQPTIPELAREVASRYSRGETAVERVLQEMKRMIKDASTYEHVLLDAHEITGRQPLPPSR